MNKLFNFTIMMSLMLLVSGCGLLYDCDAAETEIVDLQQELLDNTVMATCNPYVDKVNEYVDEGCGEDPGTVSSCQEFVCLFQTLDYNANLAIMALNSPDFFGGDSATYCTYYDSAGYNAQAMADAGGCSNELGAPVTQAFVDAWVSNGCDWGSDTTSSVSSPSFPFENISEKEMINIINEQVSMLPEEYGAKIMRKLERHTSL